jgi:hypothetical protein
MNRKDINGLRYYIIYCIALLSFFTYSGLVGWKWFNPTKTEPVRGRPGSTGHTYRYHK